MRLIRGTGLITQMDQLAPGLELVEEELQRQIKTESDNPVAAMLKPLLLSGGKRLRPALTLVSAGKSTPGKDEIRAAAAVEMIHAASLIHDDIMDESKSRRGEPALHVTHGPSPAVLGGDYLFSWAFRLLSHVRCRAVMSCMVSAVGAMCQGQAEEWLKRGDVNQTVAEYLQRSLRKTGALIGASCKAGALLGGRSATQVQALTRFGLLMGLAFQLTDDLLDLLGDPLRMGKPVGKDISAGVFTLPVIHSLQLGALKETGPGSPGPGHWKAETVAQAARDSGGICRTQRLAMILTEKAARSLATLPTDDPTRLKLTALVEVLRHRSA